MSYLRCFVWALQVLWELTEISIVNRLRLWRKSRNLFLAFLAFTDRERPAEQLSGAMSCAVLSAVYDYDTDWIRTPDPEASFFFRLLNSLLQDHPSRTSAITIARKLFRTDWGNRLSVSGLERGSAALRFYRLVIGSRWMAEYSDDEIDFYGRNLQIIDDLIDRESDARSGDTNCFLTPDAQLCADQIRLFFLSRFYCALEENSLFYRLFRVRCERKLKEIAL